MVVKRRREACWMLLAWTVLAVLLLSPTVSANTVILSRPSEGTFVYTPFVPPGQPYLASGLGIVEGPSPGGSTKGAMVFDLSFIPKGTTITTASFTMSVGGSSYIYGPPNLTILDYVAPGSTVSLGDFSLATNDVGGIGGLPYNPNAPPGSINVVQMFNVLAFVQSLVNNGTPYAGFQFEDNHNLGLGGSEFIPGSTAPSLTITSPAFLIVPEPRSALMLAMGIGGVLLVSIVARPLGITKRCVAGRTRR
jgi:hypothetical protein